MSNAMAVFEYIVSVVDAVLDSKRRRSILGGVLLSTSLFFAGLAFTVISLKENKQ